MYDISGILADFACDHYDIEGDNMAYKNAIDNTIIWFNNGNHSIEELDNRIGDLAEHFRGRNIRESLYLAGIKF